MEEENEPKLFLELGQVIKIEAPTDPTLHDKIYLISYLDNNLIKLIDNQDLSEKVLNKKDFYPFKSSKAKLAMTAHIVYSKIDSKNVSTFSSKVIKKIIRKKIGYKGILMSDDISMKALKYDLITNAKKSLAAGCNLVLYCSGNTKDNFKLIKNVPYIDKFTSKKTSEIYKILR